MTINKPNNEPDDRTWPPSPSPERPMARPVAKPEMFPMAPVAMGVIAGILSPVVLMIALAALPVVPVGMFWETPLILPVQFAVFRHCRKTRPAFAKIYLVVSMLVSLALIFMLFRLRDLD